MLDEYEIERLNPRKNPYAPQLKQQITINIDKNAIAYFKDLSKENNIPYQTLINLFLVDCAKNKRKPNLSWK